MHSLIESVTNLRKSFIFVKYFCQIKLIHKDLNTFLLVASWWKAAKVLTLNSWYKCVLDLAFSEELREELRTNLLHLFNRLSLVGISSTHGTAWNSMLIYYWSIFVGPVREILAYFIVSLSPVYKKVGCSSCIIFGCYLFGFFMLVTWLFLYFVI